MTPRALALLLLALALPAAAQTTTGRLTASDPTLDDGSHYVTVPVELRAGQTLTATLRSDDFDAYLSVASPSGEVQADDDGGGGTDSRVVWTVPETGTYTVWVNTIGAGETGRYTLSLDTGGATPGGASGVQTYTGRLDPSDVTLSDGSYADSYPVELQVGQTLTATLRSDDFDAYLHVLRPDETTEADDDSGGGTDSRLTLTATTAGRHIVVANSLRKGATGAYTLTVETSGGGSGQTRPASGTAGPRFAGALASGDRTLSSGEYVDTYEVEVRAGQRIEAALTSGDFDTYLVVRSPSGDQSENDDCTAGATDRSCVSVVASESGTWQVWATSYASGETGAYAVAVDLGAGGAAGGERFESGTLASGDRTLTSGEFYDEYTFEGTGGPVVVDLRSSTFDTYLFVKSTDDDQVDNDDHEGSRSRSMLVVDTVPGRTYRALVTSYRPGETGPYDLRIQTGGDDAAPLAAGRRTEAGALAPGDETLRTGEFVDTFTFTGVPGQRITLDLTSDAFDTYLLVQPPSGETVQDDDGGGSTSHSRLAMDLTEPGTYTVYVTSYAAKETGPYQLAMDFSERFGATATASGQAAPEDDGTATGSSWEAVDRQIQNWTLAETIPSALDPSDQRLTSGEYVEVHTFDGDANEPIRVQMTSDAFDTYLVVETPSGQRLFNDDDEADPHRSAVEFVMPETGRYRILATSYAPGETGAYQLRLSQIDALRPDPPAFDRIVGVFMGISDYAPAGDFPGPGDLPLTAQDARLVYDALETVGMRPEDGVLLVDDQATVANLRAAIEDLAARTDDRTLFVLFYSGHGGQVARADGYQRADPDGKDETLALYDRPLTDDELDALLAPLRASRQLLVVDACFSGGFAKDVITRPGRMGMFSSEEDVVSATAGKFQAGGYLSRFFSDAVAGRQADEDGNGAISALELSQYVYERYRGDVRNTGREIIQARETRPAHQKLVVDRGSVGLYDTMFVVGR